MVFFNGFSSPDSGESAVVEKRDSAPEFLSSAAGVFAAPAGGLQPPWRRCEDLLKGVVEPLIPSRFPAA
jgi:hypothetical protein